jgi:methyltransferase-like protein/2-polyprenyl-3-methyl-5-hydroxy-6-metoxy-1,4-benzoquinol methylase
MTIESNPRYDQVPYPSNPFERSHPRWIFTIATLFGMKAPPPDSARILELGCASGGNLIPMAEALPESTCVGVDLSNRQVQDGLRLIEATGLRNVTLRQASILDLDDSYGDFDYVICHGVYSWVPREVQQRILEICSKRLTPNGVAYVSYNTLPGWGMLGMLRDMMRFHASRFKDPAKQIAQSRALLQVLAKTVPSQDNPYGMLLKQSSEKLEQTADWYIYHEHLEEDNDPVYFHEFVGRAGALGLQFLGEAELLSMLTNQLPPEVQAALREVSGNIVHSEQYMDFFRNRTFRESLLCRQEVALTRKIDADSIKPMAFASDLAAQPHDTDLRAYAEVTFSALQRPTIGVSDPIFKAALIALREAWPRFVPVLELEAKVRTRLELPPATAKSTHDFVDRLWGWYTRRVVQMTASQTHCSSSVAAKPVASIVARAQVKGGRSLVTNLLHRPVKLGAFDAAVLSLLDGTRDRESIREFLTSSPVSHETTQSAQTPLTDRIAGSLTRLADAALLRA